MTQPTTLFQEHCRKECVCCLDGLKRHEVGRRKSVVYLHCLPSDQVDEDVECAVQLSEPQWLEARVREVEKQRYLLSVALMDLLLACDGNPGALYTVAAVVKARAAIRAMEPEGVKNA